MNTLAEWANYERLMNHTGRMAWFKKIGPEEYRLIGHLKEYDPRVHADQFIDLVNIAIERGIKITVEKRHHPARRYINICGICEQDGAIATSEAIDYQRAVVNSLLRIVEKNNL